MTLTSKELREKIDIVTKDISKLQGEGSEKKVEALSLYIDYLKDELKEAEIAERSNKGT
jgi:hypothetical protein